MLKIVHIVSRFDIGGAEKVALNIAKSSSKDIEYHIIEVAKANSGYSEQFIKDAKISGVIIHRSRIANIKIAILCFPIRLNNFIKQYHPDIIHTHTEIPDLSIYLSSILFPRIFKRIKIVRTIHNNQLWNNWNRLGKRVERFIQKNAINVAISESTRQSYAHNYGQKCRLIYNGVEMQTQELFPEIVHGRINIIFAARMEYQKGVDVMIDVFGHFGNDNRFQFYVAGSGTEQDKVKRELSKFDNIKIYDRVDNLAKVIGSFDYLFMPSLFEGLALTPMEAALAGTPPIINCALGLYETVPANWPLMVRDNNRNDYINIFENTRSVNYAMLQSQAFEFAKKEFSIGEMQQKYITLYNEIQGKIKPTAQSAT